MAKKNEEKKDINEEKKDISKTWADSYTAVSKIWEDSYSKLYKPWIESTGEMFEKAALISKDATPEKYREFYNEWVKTHENTFGDFYPIPTLKSNKETLEKLLASAEESNKLYRSWITRLEENSKITQETLKSEQDPAKYKEVYDLWIKSYGKIFDELLELPSRKNMREIFENYPGIPDIYSETFVQISRLWKNSYAKLYGPWSESIEKLSEKAAEISKGGASPEDYKEFYNMWLNTYQETFGGIQSTHPSKEVFENFAQSANIYLNFYKSWITELEKLEEKAKKLSKQTTDPERSKEFYNLWVNTYEKAFNSFIEDTPTVGPLKEILEPVKNGAKIYADTFTKISKLWVNSFTASRV